MFLKIQFLSKYPLEYQMHIRYYWRILCLFHQGYILFILVWVYYAQIRTLIPALINNLPTQSPNEDGHLICFNGLQILRNVHFVET